MHRRTILALTLFALLLVPSRPAAQTVLDCNAVYPALSLPTRGAQLFADKARDYSGGALEIAVRPDGAMGLRGPELLAAVRDGRAPLSDVLMGAVSGAERGFGLSSLPLVARSFDEARRLYDQAKPLYAAMARQWNAVLLYAAPWPPSGLFSETPLPTAADLAGLRVRTYDITGAGFLARAGAAPLSLPWGELAQAMQTGLVDAVLTSAASGLDAALWRRLHHFTRIELAYPLYMLLMNRQTFAALDQDQRQALWRAAAETEEAQWRAAEQEDAQDIRALQTHGVVIHTPTPELRQALATAAGAMLDEFLWRASPEIRSLLTSFRAH